MDSLQSSVTYKSKNIFVNKKRKLLSLWMSPNKIGKGRPFQNSLSLFFIYTNCQSVLFFVTVTVAAHELINTSGSIDQFSLTCVERVRSA